MSLKRAYVFFIIWLVGFFIPLDAVSRMIRGDTDPLLRGYAQIEWHWRGRVYRFDQVILIESTEKVQLETIDEFGQTIGQITLYSSDLPMKAVIKKIPLFLVPVDEFIHLLLHEVPPRKDSIVVTRESNGMITGIEKKSKKRRDRYQVFYSDFRKVDSEIYPFRMVLESRRLTLSLMWRRVEMQ